MNKFSAIAINDTPHESGIYIIRNMVNNNFYIGSSTTINQRIKTHLSKLKYGKHFSELMNRDFAEYGIDNFTVGVVECNDDFMPAVKARESQYIKDTKPQYNTNSKRFADKREKKNKHRAIFKVTISQAPPLSWYANQIGQTFQAYENRNREMRDYYKVYFAKGRATPKPHYIRHEDIGTIIENP